MEKINEIKDQCYQLELIGIKPSLLIAGEKVIDEIYDYTGWDRYSSIWVKMSINGNELMIVRVDDPNMAEVFGNSIIDAEGK